MDTGKVAQLLRSASIFFARKSSSLALDDKNDLP